ncbi:hypothetical protein JD276_15145 [Leucobacter sp. CSA1]|uniref:ABC-2 type transport system permease protein n=1 Tax=Leucobacter chromiisoli TaxID=2796471 RepID=A0A934UVA1_9MICO|nr:hypothetical protein [Leucobacter chromiisoli]MBK0420364.1 hypothetical protein [Leucobacter chromiisoli]
MVARLCRLRLTLLAATFRGSFAHGLRAALVLVLLFAAAVGLAALPARLVVDEGYRATIDVLAGTIVLGAALIVPVFENRRLLEPRQFAALPVKPAAVAWALFLTTVLSWPFLLLLAWFAGLLVFRPEWRGTPILAVAALLLGALLAIAFTRVASAASQLVIGPDHAGVMRAVGVLLLVAFLPVAVFAVATTFGPSESSAVEAAAVMGWTPFGAPFAGLALAASGDTSAALLRLGVAAAALLVLLAVWFPLVRASNERVDRPSDPAIARRGLGWFERFPARPAPVIAARALTYWARDPRYRVALVAIPFAPIVMLIAFWVAGADLPMLTLIPLPVILLLLGWSLHNDIAMDSTAIWEHVASGIRGREDRWGRLAPVMLVGLPLVLVGSSLTVTVLGDWRVLPAVIGMNLSILLVSAGVSSLFSVLMPYPATRPGDSPFVQPQWSGSGSGLAQTLSMLLALALSVPPVWFAAWAILDIEFAPNIWALLFGAGYGAIVLAAGVLIGGRVFDRSSPELIAVTQVFD